MSSFNAEKHIDDVSKIIDALTEFLKNGAKLLSGGSKEKEQPINLEKEAKNLFYGKPSSFMQITRSNVEVEGKFKLLKPANEGEINLCFLEKKATLELPPQIKEQISNDDLVHLKETGHLNRIIYVDQDGVAKPKYVSVDKDLNRIGLQSIDSFKLKDVVMGLTLSQEEKLLLKDGKSVLLTGLINPKNPDKPFDSIVTIDASKRDLSFQTPNKGIPKVLGGKQLSEEQLKTLEKGETIIALDLYSKVKEKNYDAFVSKNPDGISLDIVSFSVPKKLLSRELAEKDIQELRIGNEVFIKGMTSKTGDSFDAAVRLDKEKGIVFNKAVAEIGVNKDEIKEIIGLKKTPNVLLNPILSAQRMAIVLGTLPALSNSVSKNQVSEDLKQEAKKGFGLGR